MVWDEKAYKREYMKRYYKKNRKKELQKRREYATKVRAGLITPKKRIFKKDWICIDCKRKKDHHAKGLCKNCYDKHNARRYYLKEENKERHKEWVRNNRKRINKAVLKHYYNGNKEKFTIRHYDTYHIKKYKLKDNCEECGATTDLERHHITYEKKGDSILQTLCRTCHRKIHRKGLIVTIQE